MICLTGVEDLASYLSFHVSQAVLAGNSQDVFQNADNIQTAVETFLQRLSGYVWSNVVCYQQQDVFDHFLEGKHFVKLTIDSLIVIFRSHLFSRVAQDKVEIEHQNARVYITNLGDDQANGGVALQSGQPARHREDSQDDPREYDQEPQQVQRAEKVDVRVQLGGHDRPHHQGGLALHQPLLRCGEDGQIGPVHDAVQLHPGYSTRQLRETIILMFLYFECFGAVVMVVKSHLKFPVLRVLSPRSFAECQEELEDP